MYNKYILVWFGLALVHISYCWLFNAKFSLFIFIKIYDLVLLFYGILTILGYFMPKASVYIYIEYI